MAKPSQNMDSVTIWKGRSLRAEGTPNGVSGPDATLLAVPVVVGGLLVMGAHTLAQFEVMGLHEIPIGPEGVRALTDALWNGLAPKQP